MKFDGLSSFSSRWFSIKKPSFSKCTRTSKKPGKNHIKRKIKNRQIGIRNRNTDAVNERRIHNVSLGDRGHDVSPFCPKKCPATKRQDNRAASRCNLCFYLFDYITGHISCQLRVNYKMGEHKEKTGSNCCRSRSLL